MNILIALLSSILCSGAAGPDIDSLMREMTLEEKIGQMSQLVGPRLTGPASSTDRERKIREGKVGSLLNVTGQDAVRLQKIAVEDSRLGIPLVIGMDVIHGYETCFPIPLAMSCSWDPDEIENACRISGAEASRDGVAWTFTPMCDIARDPRWGRVAEGAGEDPYLGSRIAEAQVRGFQGSLDKPTDIAACVKHFALYGAAQAGRDYYTTDMSRVQMMNEYMPPYQAAIDAGALTVMSSFNEFEGIPMTVHPYMLDTLLRGRMGFEGMLVTDYTAIKETVQHGTSPDLEDAALKAARAGVDMEMVSEGFSTYLADAVRDGRLDEAVVDRSCRRVLELKRSLSLFDNPYKYNRPEELPLNGSPEAREASRRLASKSAVLLKNEGGILPLQEGRKIAVIGPLADLGTEMIGTWAIRPKTHSPVSLLQGLKERFGEENVNFERGCHVLGDEELETRISYYKNPSDRGWDRSVEQLRKDALSLAKKSDVIVAAMGELALMSGEGTSLADVRLSAPQRELLSELKTLGKPLILVVMAGRPLVLEWESENADAILYAWHLGSEAGRAVAGLLSGDVNPSGRLSMTFPRSVGQIPIFYNHKSCGRPAEDDAPYHNRRSQYMDVVNAPLYYFGYGLSYSDISYSDLSVEAGPSRICACVTLHNASERDATETVQLYIRDKVASITRPVAELKAFKKVQIKAGETVRVQIPLEKSAMGFFGSDLSYRVEPGEFEIMVGPSSDPQALLKAQFEL